MPQSPRTGQREEEVPARSRTQPPLSLTPAWVLPAESRPCRQQPCAPCRPVCSVASSPVPLAGLFAEWSCSQSPRTAQGPARAVPSAAAGRGDPGMPVSRGWGSSGEPGNQGKEHHQSLGLRGTLEPNRAFTGPSPKWGPQGEEQGGLIRAGEAGREGPSLLKMHCPGVE